MTIFPLSDDAGIFLDVPCCPVRIVVCTGCGWQSSTCCCWRLHQAVHTPVCGRCTATDGDPIPDEDALP